MTTGRGQSGARAFRLGLVMGAVAFGGTIYWVADVMALYGGLGRPVAVLIAGLLVAYMALYPALFAFILSRAARRFGMAGVWCAPAVWVATEWLRGTVGGGFPWVPVGASQASVLPVVQASSVVGVYGLSLFVVLISTAGAAVALSRSRATRAGALAVAVVFVGVVAAGAWRLSSSALLHEGATLRVGLLQGSVDQDQKYDARFQSEIMNRYLALSRKVIAEGAEVVIWPEASTPFYLDVDAVLAQPIRRLALESKTPFIIGTDELERATGDGPDRYYNSAVLIGTDGRSRQSYRKMQLVPFGEYVPLKTLLFFVGPLIEAVSDFSAGTEAVVLDADGRRMSVAICYESVYPEIAREFVERGSQLLVTITNDAWFGRSSAAYQHFEQGAIRAVEQGRYVVRAANTGFSGAVDPYGRVMARTNLFEPAALTVDVRLLTGRTIYSRVGDLAVWLSLVVAGLLLATTLRSRREPDAF